MIAALPSLWRGVLALISDPSCPLCAGAAASPALLCEPCLRRLALPEGGIQGDEPLLWCAAAPYDGALRQLLLRQRPRPEPALMAALALEWHRCCRQVLPGAVLVPIPSWKRRGNPLPLLLAQALEPLIPKDLPCHFASLSARVGSIGDNRSGGWYAYRAAKAAQNQLLRTLALEWRRRLPQMCVSLLHPGTTATRLSQPFQANVPAGQLFSPERAASQLLDVLAGLGPDQSGGFWAWDGQPIPW